MWTLYSLSECWEGTIVAPVACCAASTALLWSEDFGVVWGLMAHTWSTNKKKRKINQQCHSVKWGTKITSVVMVWDLFLFLLWLVSVSVVICLRFYDSMILGLCNFPRLLIIKKNSIFVTGFLFVFYNLPKIQRAKRCTEKHEHKFA